ncbi:GNAT family N-acetyltransferase [uncultured Clostridium sp.]|uniref:GNAT family N-acetyltransferase n=1 Tax=uncultured Clostridium sp. TaxID=59620 RepID=UPI00258A6ADD|nr:GNAT family N-acetyltransferase [uncultured Clostridium sp.]
MEIKLIKPTLEYSNDIMEYKKEFLKSGDTMAGCGNLGECSTAEEWINENELRENSKTVPSDKVSSNAYIAVRMADNKIVGMINFRHHINHPILSTWGGHIGYSVRPCERKKGYAKEMLRQVIINCKSCGLEKILVTCNKDNMGSKRTIIANGGLFEKYIEVDGDVIERYWINLQ